MSYIQVVSPNLSTVGRLGYCLEYARKCFGAAAVEPNAWTAWNNTKFRLNDTPQGVSYLNWYSYFEGGVNLGHVTITTPNGIYSSPWQSGTDHAVLPSIAEVERIYGVKYVGSSGDISNVQVIKENDMLTPAEVNQLCQIAFNRPANDDEKSVYSSIPTAEALQRILDGAENIGLRTAAQAYWDKNVAAQTLQPGIYKVN